jgi:hypothetical protein
MDPPQNYVLIAETGLMGAQFQWLIEPTDTKEDQEKDDGELQ